VTQFDRSADLSVYLGGIVFLLFLLDDSPYAGKSQRQTHTETFRDGDLRSLDGDREQVLALKVHVRLIVRLQFAKDDPFRGVAAFEWYPFVSELFPAQELGILSSDWCG
jgi:hypothetical protein